MARRDSWTEKLLDRIAARPRVLVVLDFDGTLVPMRARPVSQPIRRPRRC